VWGRSAVKIVEGNWTFSSEDSSSACDCYKL
jgi:hypothetical protein